MDTVRSLLLFGVKRDVVNEEFNMDFEACKAGGRAPMPFSITSTSAMLDLSILVRWARPCCSFRKI